MFYNSRNPQHIIKPHNSYVKPHKRGAALSLFICVRNKVASVNRKGFHFPQTIYRQIAFFVHCFGSKSLDKPSNFNKHTAAHRNIHIETGTLVLKIFYLKDLIIAKIVFHTLISFYC